MLDHTPKEIKERKAVVINPAKTCQPLGATYAALGIHRCLPHSHGSQGCQMYFRGHLNRHFREPAEASTSSLTIASSWSRRRCGRSRRVGNERSSSGRRRTRNGC